jgi:hypothetical protein
VLIQSDTDTFAVNAAIPPTVWHPPEMRNERGAAGNSLGSAQDVELEEVREERGRV